MRKMCRGIGSLKMSKQILSRFCSIGGAENSEAVPIRIPFELENLQHVGEVISSLRSKQELQVSHRQFLTYLTSDVARGKAEFERFESSNKHLYTYIKQNILTGEGFDPTSDFITRSHYYFQSEGKKVRPTMVKMIAHSLNAEAAAGEAVQKWGALIEMMHISSLAHDDIIDDSPSRRGVESQHLKYGKRSAVFSANFIIAKASKTIYDFRSPKLYQIYSVAMDNLATGEIIQAVSKNSLANAPKNLRDHIETYLHKTYYKTAALMANALRAVPVLLEGSTSQQELASFRVGQHFGIAFQLVDDIIDYTSTAEAMGKENLADIREGNVTGPVYLSLLGKKETPWTLSQLREKHKSKEQAEEIKKWVMSEAGIELTFALADLHIKRGLSYLRGFPNPTEDAWKYLAYKILSRNK